MELEEYLRRERVKSMAERRNRERRMENRRQARSLAEAAKAFAASGLLLALGACSAFPPSFAAEARQADRLIKIQRPASAPEQQLPEEAENERIEAALLDRARVIEDCTVTWYTAETCGKTPGHPAYGITASGLSVVEHLTCATDPAVIPTCSDVFVQYADGIIEQLWATDTGVTGDWVDIYTPDRETALQNGRQTLTVWFVPQDEE